jgi:hypothetical protein
VSEKMEKFSLKKKVGAFSLRNIKFRCLKLYLFPLMTYLQSIRGFGLAQKPFCEQLRDFFQNVNKIGEKSGKS